MTELQPRQVLAFWFGGRDPREWFEPSRTFDRACREALGPGYEAARAGALESWADTPEGALALVILLDQVPRNLFRDDPRTHECDALALAVAHRAIERGFHERLEDWWLAFLLMPLQHSEDLADQELSVRLTAGRVPPIAHEHAKKHRDVIARFGRFPHRNRLLGRASTPEELAFLAEEGRGF